MLPTALSYGRMANAYPSAGSAFTYVGREINPFLGYLAGWGMVMDYLLNPLISIIWVSQQAHVYMAAIPYSVWAILFAALATGLTIHGIRVSARVNAVMGSLMGVVIVLFLAAVVHYVLKHPHADSGFFIRPFYDPKAWDLTAILGGTSLAMLTYIGFDGISTLSEECENPRRNILIATVMTCVVVSILSIVEVYGAELVWPASEPFPDLDTAFTFAAQRAWAPLFVAVGVTLMVALMAIAIAAQLALARLLYGMGRSGALPKGLFGVDPCDDPYSPQQRTAHRCPGPDWGAHPARDLGLGHRLRARGESRELRRADLLHGGERGGVRALLPARR
jgi:putrescine importer